MLDPELTIKELGICRNNLDYSLTYFDDKRHGNAGHVSVLISDTKTILPPYGSIWDNITDSEFRNRYTIMLESSYGRLKSKNY